MTKEKESAAGTSEESLTTSQGHVDPELSEVKLPYPKSVFVIIGNEFCERFSYYGIRTILVLYLRNKLRYDDDTSTVIYHIFSMFCYFFPLIGAMIADSWLGKFKTIFYVSIIYAIGQLVLAASATPPLNLPDRAFALIGLGLIAVGTGGIKPCVAAFGGDQFVMPQQARYLVTFFSLFYFAINTGSLISTFLTPILRADVSCFDDNTCYSLAFFVPSLLMILSIVIFISGKPLYTIKSPQGNVVLQVGKCVWYGLSKKIKAKKGEERDYWLDHADDKYDTKFISDIRTALQVIKMFLPLPIFWALFDQQGSRWTIQATRMDGQIGSFLLKPDQMQVVNPLLIIILIPLFEAAIYPCLTKLRLLQTPLQKLTAGGLLAAVAFFISAVVELQLEKTYPVLPSSGLAQVRIFNTLNCSVPLTVGDDTFTLSELGVWENKYVEASGDVTLNYTASFASCSNLGMTDGVNGVVTGQISGTEAAATSWVITDTGISHSYTDTIDKTTSGDPAIRALVHLNSDLGGSININFVENSQTSLSLPVSSNFSVTELTEISAGLYDVYANSTLIESGVNLKLGGIYTITAYINDLSTAAVSNTITITEPNSMHMLWLLPQYIIITIGEIMFSVTGLEFAFTQSAVSMKSLLQACWLLTVAFGNLIVVIVAEFSLFDSQAHEFFLFGGLMVADMLIFGVMSLFYKYVEVADEEDESQNGDIVLKEKSGVVNPSLELDDAK